MARRNLTLQLDEAVIRKARVLAARRGTSISGLVARGGRTWRRDELHDR
jgi:hypothetical protein